MREDQWSVGVIVNGRNLGVWDKLTGGEVDSDESLYKPGGMAPPISLGGSVNVGTITVSRNYVLPRDHATLHWLIGLAGKGNVTISKKALDPDGNVFGKPLTYKCRLKTVTPPPVDSESSNAAMIELQCTPQGTVT